ncbi:sugar ABC transporter substrate-binding protein [Abyssibius alkaniclasticus]|uniref:ABC transporter substrate-binding protein n=1 Tax=Abyssibius alkaniclasticus TaxID=2881234 RepID=UPI00236464B5|nr:sugar ABC transporter substrate-binding protein [Abyssibius alkaniclasticus]UPH72233.1 sugar ABC transporter substrate-binding protein [Abyssibius alkaniclasticus]
MTKTFTKASLAALLASSTALSAVSAQEAKTIQIATHYNEAQMGPLLECFAAYEASNPGITIEFQQAAYGDFLQTILTSRVGGTSPDIYNIYSIWAPQLAAAGTLAEPPADVQDWIRASYGAGSVGAATINGTLWGIPTELSVYQLFYNKKILAEAGFDAPPATWQELHDMAAAITTTNDQGVIDRAGYVYGPSVANAVHVYYSQMYAAGVPPFADDFRSTNFTSPESIEIVERMGALFAEGITSNTNITDDFAAGSAAMMIAANWNKAELQEVYGDEFENTVGIAPIPNNGGPAGTMLYSFLWAVDSTSDVQAESWELLQWLNTAQEGKPLSCTGEMLNNLGALSGNLADLAGMDTGDSFTAPFVAAIESGAAKSQPNIWQASENDRTLRSYIEQVWAGNMSAADAMAAADAEVTAVLNEQP